MWEERVSSAVAQPWSLLICHCLFFTLLVVRFIHPSQQIKALTACVLPGGHCILLRLIGFLLGGVEWVSTLTCFSRHCDNKPKNLHVVKSWAHWDPPYPWSRCTFSGQMEPWLTCHCASNRKHVLLCPVWQHGWINQSLLTVISSPADTYLKCIPVSYGLPALFFILLLIHQDPPLYKCKHHHIG